MDRSYWRRQGTEPLYPDLLWSRPENRLHAGKLLIVGGNSHGFAAVAEAYNASVKAGIGTARVLLPDAIQKVVKMVLETADYAPSTPSGSFASKSLSDWLEHAAWADGVLLAGDFGKNSETSIVLEKFLSKFTGAVTITKDAVDYFYAHPDAILNRPDTTAVLSIAQLQRLAREAHYTQVVTFSMDLLHLVDWLHDFTSQNVCNITVKHLDTIFVAVNGQVSTTKSNQDLDGVWRVPTAAHSSVWWLQNPSKTFEALTTALISS